MTVKTGPVIRRTIWKQHENRRFETGDLGRTLPFTRKTSGSHEYCTHFDLVKEGRYEELNVTFRKCFLRILGGYRRCMIELMPFLKSIGKLTLNVGRKELLLFPDMERVRGEC